MSQTKEMPAHHKAPVPAAVRAAAAAADAAFEAAQKAGGGDPDPASPPASPSPASGAAPAAPTTTTVVEPAPQPQPQPQPQPAPQEPTVDWKHRYDSLYGKHTAETQSLRAELDGLHRVIAAMQSVQPAPAGPGAPAPGGGQPSILDFKPLTAEEKEEFSPEFLDIAERVAMQRFAPIVQQLQDKIAQLEGGVGQVRQQVEITAQDRVLMQLAAKFSDWEVQNTDPAFLGWLAQPDLMSGLTRKQMLDNAMQNAHADRVIAIFQAYRNEAAAATPGPQPSPTNPAPAAGRTSLETLAAPGKGRPGTATSAPGPQAGNAPVFTQSSIAKFYDEVRRGVWRNDPAGKAKREQEIVEASTQGRVIAG